METALAIWIVIVAVIVGMIVFIFFKANLCICPPNEMLIFSGRQRKLPDGTILGYRILKGGRGFKLPVIEKVHRMSLAAMPVEIAIKGALSSGIIPVDVRGMATIKIAGTEEAGLSNAVERFLGKTTDKIVQIAKEVIEGNLRGVLATMTPEEANSKRLEFAQNVIKEARDDFRQLGLMLDTLKILNISDDQGYLESIGRKKNAEVRRDAKIAEAQADAEARKVVADAKKKANVAEVESNMVIVEADNKLRVRTADLASEACQAEERAKVAGEIARVEEEQKLEVERVTLNKTRYEADVVIPAQTEKEAKELKAKGDAARIIEDGKATATAVKLMREQWEKGNTKELFLIQQLPDIIGRITSVMKDNLAIEKLTVVDSGNGGGIPAVVKGITGSLVAVMEQVKNATGLDVPKILQSESAESGNGGKISKKNFKKIP